MCYSEYSEFTSNLVCVFYMYTLTFLQGYFTKALEMKRCFEAKLKRPVVTEN